MEKKSLYTISIAQNVFKNEAKRKTVTLLWVSLHGSSLIPDILFREKTFFFFFLEYQEYLGKNCYVTGNVIWEGDPLRVIAEPEFLALRLETPSREWQNIEGCFYKIVIWFWQPVYPIILTYHCGELQLQVPAMTEKWNGRIFKIKRTAPA